MSPRFPLSLFLLSVGPEHNFALVVCSLFDSKDTWQMITMHTSNINRKLKTLRYFCGFVWLIFFYFFCNFIVCFLSVSFVENIISSVTGWTCLVTHPLSQCSAFSQSRNNKGSQLWVEPKHIISPFKLFVPSIFSQ